MKCVYTAYSYIYMFYVLLRCKRLFMHMRVSKRKKNWKKVARSTKAAKKEVFVQNMLFPQIVFSS